MGMAFRQGVGVDDFALRAPVFKGGLATFANALTRFDGGLVSFSRLRFFGILVLCVVAGPRHAAI